MSSRSLWFLAYPGIQTLDLTGPFEVFSSANRLLVQRGTPGRCYELSVFMPAPQSRMSRAGRPLSPANKSAQTIQTGSGLQIAADPLPTPSPGPDTLLIPGGDGVHAAARDASLTEWVREVADGGARIATICTGAFMAGAAGLLEERNVTTHWASTDLLQSEHPAANVAVDSLYIQDQQLWSSAGVTAGIDLALALVEEDHDGELAQDVARWLVVFLRRPGGQSQFAPPVWTRTAQSRPVQEAQDFIAHDPSVDLSVAAVARRVGVSPRHFSRLFQQETGQTPGRYVEAVRISAARHHLERSTDTVEAIATRCGFTSPEVLRRAFHRQVGTSPDAYRKHHALR